MNEGNIISFSPVIRVEGVREGFWRNQSPALDRRLGVVDVAGTA